ncbi:lysine transporter LysE [Sulfitobacter alexandrii]|uniref:Lysine transporter LysE n=1 Tax=Sulfitobacter alexandrii TaxID=1917485 RepID=A0A1J0WLP9_9RHOB|nr:LysE family translocator [Sulfitobacter alexandrii]APE45203.1 lysine transporter LysE [Sulfitobacter alexandrii]
MTVSLHDLLLYAGAMVALFITPGPVMVAMMARAMSGGFRAAWPLALGVSIGDLLWPLVAALGITWILSVFDVFMVVLRGVACLVFLVMGILLIRHREATPDRDSRLTRPGMWAGFVAGLIAILGNPKAVLFYVGVLPGFFDLRVVTWQDLTAIVAVSVIIPLVGNLILAAGVDRIRTLLTNPRILRRINVVSGLLLICVGLLIPLI